ncbi:hypothetical protein IE53DRAFT_178290 [Violaceomyces palustris]|uniref:Uncharacterized protein n=1 Tax=Violaceomyces palustris TaxID=1673888 RepID=A0ACD0NSG4_9BASI|nr:hypothetical protein IE53DRAFT_178290 [Violaceomyces palustris]
MGSLLPFPPPFSTIPRSRTTPPDREASLSFPSRQEIFVQLPPTWWGWWGGMRAKKQINKVKEKPPKIPTLPPFTGGCKSGKEEGKETSRVGEREEKGGETFRRRAELFLPLPLSLHLPFLPYERTRLASPTRNASLSLSLSPLPILPPPLLSNFSVLSLSLSSARSIRERLFPFLYSWMASPANPSSPLANPSNPSSIRDLREEEDEVETHGRLLNPIGFPLPTVHTLLHFPAGKVRERKGSRKKKKRKRGKERKKNSNPKVKEKRKEDRKWKEKGMRDGKTRIVRRGRHFHQTPFLAGDGNRDGNFLPFGHCHLWNIRAGE